jgi:microcystin-dependent protein
MSTPFVGQIQPFAFQFAPQGWAFCNGQTMQIAQNTALYSLIGTTYGGDGQTTYMLPNLQSRVPLHAGTFNGNAYSQGQPGGEESVTLLAANVPPHSHSLLGTATAGNNGTPAAGAALAATSNQNTNAVGDPAYAPSGSPLQPLNPGSIPAGSGATLPHSNLQPFLVINWCIALNGVFPSHN